MKVEKIWENEEENIYYCNGVKIETVERLNPNNNNLIFSFSGIKSTPSGKFNSPEYLQEFHSIQSQVEGYNLIGNIDDCDVIFLKDKYNDEYGYYIENYNREIFEEIKAFILSKISEKKYQKVITFGISKGGWASLLYGLGISEIDEVYTVCPQVLTIPTLYGTRLTQKNLCDYVVKGSYQSKRVSWYTSFNDMQITEQKQFIDKYLLEENVILQVNEVDEGLHHNNISRYFSNQFASDISTGIEESRYSIFSPYLDITKLQFKKVYSNLTTTQTRELLYRKPDYFNSEIEEKATFDKRDDINLDYDFSQVDISDPFLTTINTLKDNINIDSPKVILNLFDFEGDIELFLSTVTSKHLNIIVNREEHYKYIISNYIINNSDKEITVHKTDKSSLNNVISFLYYVLYEQNKLNNGKRIYFWKFLDRNQQHAFMINYEKFNYLVNPFNVQLTNNGYKFEPITPNMKILLETSKTSKKKEGYEITDVDKFSYITIEVNSVVSMQLIKINLLQLIIA